MKAFQIYTTTALGVICLVLCISSRALHRGNQELQVRAQTQQTEIAKGNQLNQEPRIKHLLEAMARLSVNNPKIREVLKASNYTVTINQPEAAPESAPAPSPEPTPAQ